MGDTSGNFFLISYAEHHQLIRIVKTARDLSFKIQHGILSHRLFVMIAASAGEVGTYAFGLERLAEGGRSVLLEATTSFVCWISIFLKMLDEILYFFFSSFIMNHD
jgi:hypothetical protein